MSFSRKLQLKVFQWCMLRAILNKSWRQHLTRHQLYGHFSPITKTIQVTRARQAGHCWRSMDELVSDVLLWTPTYGQAKAGRPARTYIQQLGEDTGCNPEDLPEAMNNREKWREMVKDIRAGGTTWWWWWWWWWSPISASYGSNSLVTVLLQWWFWHKITPNNWYAIKQRNQIKPKGNIILKYRLSQNRCNPLIW